MGWRNASQPCEHPNGSGRRSTRDEQLTYTAPPFESSRMGVVFRGQGLAT